MYDLTSLPPIAYGLIFALAACGVWFAGTRLAYYTDEISDRRRMGKALMGPVLLAAATELPEVVTTPTAAIAGEARLLLNNLFGGVSMQTAILAIADTSPTEPQSRSIRANRRQSLKGRC